jgi:1,4-alpha-glucan branching enzyme
MATHAVEFWFMVGLRRPIFRNPRLVGSWDANGRYSDTWSEIPMQEVIGPDGCPAFTASVLFDTTDEDRTFKWGVILDGPQGANFWGMPTEVKDVNSTERDRQFQLDTRAPTPQVERYYFTYGRYLGANKYFDASTDNATPSLRFAVWAPNALRVEVVFGDPSVGYIADDGTGIDTSKAVVALSKTATGIWEGSPPGSFDGYMGVPYMYRITNAQGDICYRTDIFSRSQIGKGDIDPDRGAWPGTPNTLDGVVSCSIVIDPDVVRRGFASTAAGIKPDFVPIEEFWSGEFTAGEPVPSNLEDLVIYELHIGSLAFGEPRPGDLCDAVAFLDHLVELGINAVELLPMAQFTGTVAWGYGDTHHMCIESGAGGRDKYRHFVRECHRRGIAVIQDVVYNHYDPHADRAEWQYDSTAPQDNIYYWFEGDPRFPDSSGYLDNGSTGYTPRFWEERVRQQFISSAAFLVEEMHVDGLRVDLTQAIHRDNNLRGVQIASANVFGQKLLREWSRTLRMIRPSVMLIAEDHTGWDAVTKPPAQGGLGFDARWELSFYHNLIGDSDMAGDRARLLKQAGFGGNEPLRMDWFAGALYGTQYNQVVFNESHDEAGNASGTARTAVVAVNGAPLIDGTRDFAEARIRLCFGLSLLSAATPMFFMGEEIGAQKVYRYNDFINNREDILGEKSGDGRRLFTFYQELITVSGRLPSVRSHNIDILHQSNDNRVIVFKRWDASDQVIIAASLNNSPFADGYVVSKDPLAIPDGEWKEIFNSDAAVYGGQNVGNYGGILAASNGSINVKIPANGFVVLVRQ